jgi:hypothetical protein
MCGFFMLNVKRVYLTFIPKYVRKLGVRFVVQTPKLHDEEKKKMRLASSIDSNQDARWPTKTRHSGRACVQKAP